jgi:putative heme-binding domain-containing protein
MKGTWTIAIATFLCAALDVVAFTQGGGTTAPPTARASEQPAKNPLEGDAAAVRAGGAKFRTRCSGCHGVDAAGYIGPDLTGLWARGKADARIFETVRKGVMGTDMPAADPKRVPDREIWEVLAYIRSLAPTATVAETGDAANGQRVFQSNCGFCHMVDGAGGQLGPDLSRIGSGRPRALLLNKVRGKGDTIRPGFEPVTLVTRNGQRIRGVKKNEDEFSIQIMDISQRIQGYLKSDLTEVISETASVMPVYSQAQLNDRDLDDLLRYLGTLRTDSARR